MKRFINIAPILAYAILLSYLFWPIFFAENGMMIFGDDISHHYYYYRQFFIDSLKQGILPLWNPYLFSGYPFLANPQSVNFFYPVSWIFFIFSLDKAFLVYLIVHLLLAMTSMYWILRRLLYNRWRYSAWTAGLVYAMSGYFVARIWAGHVDIIAGSAYIPLVFGFSWLAMTTRKQKYTVIAGLAWGLQLLVGYQTIAFFTFEAIVIMGICIIIYKKYLYPIWNLVVIALIGIGTAAIQLIPSRQFIVHSIRTFQLPYSWVSYGAHTYDSLKQLINPYALGDQITYAGPPTNYAEHAMYIGRLPIILVIAGLIMLIFHAKGKVMRKSTIHENDDKDLTLMFVICFLISLFGVWISLSKNALFDLQYLLWKALPMYKYLRIPSRHLILFVFGASILTGISLSLIKNKIIQVIILVLIVGELTVYAKHFISVMSVPDSTQDRELIAVVKNESELVRLLPNFGVWIEPRGSLDFNAAMVYNIFSVTGYDPSILRSYYEFIDAINGNSEPSILQHDVQIPYINLYSPFMNFLNIKYIFVPISIDFLGGASNERFELIREDTDRGYRLYKNPLYSPRFYLVSQASVAKDRTQALEWFRNGRVDLTDNVVLIADKKNMLPAVTRCSQRQQFKKVSVLTYTPNTIKLTVDTACSAWLVSSEVMYPGWEVFVDGQKAPLIEGNMAFRTAFVPKGSHAVVYRYNPKIFLLSFFITAVSVVCCFVILAKRPQT